MKQTVNPLGAETRAVEAGLKAFVQPDGTFRVRSSSRDLTWVVQVGAVKQDIGWLLKLTCSCEAGTSRPSEFVPCLHAATAARSLERRGLARWKNGLWQPTEQLMKGVA